MLARKPRAVANQVNVMLNTVLGTERFPLDVESVAIELSRQWSPDAPITKIVGHTGVEGFEGALQRNPDATRWRILYSQDREPARQRFTIAHEFGHFALHREMQESFECSKDDVSGQSERDIEKEADQFASALLMPLDDLRAQMRGQPFGFDLIKQCANRYGVSLTATPVRRDLRTTRGRCGFARRLFVARLAQCLSISFGCFLAYSQAGHRGARTFYCARHTLRRSGRNRAGFCINVVCFAG